MSRSAELRRNDALLVRGALMLSPVMASERAVLRDKERLEEMVSGYATAD